MKIIKQYDNFSSSINENRRNTEMLNEEWYPTGPWMNLKSIPGGTLVEQYAKHALTFIGGNKDHVSTHEDEVFQIIDTLYSVKYVDEKFELHDMDDCIINKLIFYSSNHKENKEEFLEKLKKYGTVQPGSEGGMIILELTKPIEILTKDSDEKTELRNNRNFHSKLEKLYYAIEYNNFSNTPEVNELIDKLLSLSNYKNDED